VTATLSPGYTQKYSGTPAGNRIDAIPAIAAVGFVPNDTQQSLVAASRMCAVLFGDVIGAPVVEYTPAVAIWNAAL
jgi:hypothetical protein